MTTTVIINAHLATTKKVIVEINDNESGLLVEKFALQDGESAQRVVFNGYELKVSRNAN